MKKLLALIFGISLLISGCSKPGEEYIGKWIDIKNDKIILDIQRNGENFIIRKTAPSAWNGKIKTDNIPAALENGLLKVNIGFSSINLAVDESTGFLTDSQNEYKKSN